MKARYTTYLLGTTLLILSGLSSSSVFAASCGPANSTSIIAMPIAISSLCTAPATPQCTNSAGAITTCLGNINSLGTGAGAGIYRWACLSPTAPNPAYCSANKGAGLRVNGVCGPANGNSFTNAAACNAAGLCASGTPNPSAVSGPGGWSWECLGANGGSDAKDCSASVAATTQNKNGVCGFADGGAFANAAAVNAAGLCAVGTATPVSVAGGAPRSWQCAGTNTTVSCNATQLNPTSVNGNCPPVPPHAIPNIVTSIPQVWSGTFRWPIASWSYNTTSSTTECRFTCEPGYINGYVLDPNYNIGLGSGGLSNMGLVGASYGASIKKQSDGKTIIFSHYLTSYNGTPVHGIARLNLDGTLDTSFNVGGSGFTVGGMGNIGYDMYIQNDDKILLVGDFSAYNGVPANKIIRLNANGSIDNTFVYGGGFNSYAQRITPLPGNEYFIMGRFSTYNGLGAPGMVKLTSTGARDTAFMTNLPNPGGVVYDVEAQSNGKIVIGGAAFLFRVNTDGTADTTFNNGGAGFTWYMAPSMTPSVYWPSNPTVYDIAIRNNDEIVVGGSFSSYNGVGVHNLVKLNADGSINTTFANNIGSGADGFLMGVTYDKYNDRFLIGGGFNHIGSQPVYSFGILNADGTIYSGFPTAGFNDYAPGSQVIDGQTFIVRGNFTSFSGTTTLPGVAVFGPGCVAYDSSCPPVPPTVCDISDPITAGPCYTPATSGSAGGVAIVVTGSKVGINTDTPQYTLDINGSLRAGSVFTLSDKRLKSSIEKIDGALAKIREIHGYEFTRKDSGKADMGVLAQEIEKVFADAVSTDVDGYKTVQYTALLAPIIEAIHEINASIDADMAHAQEQKTRIDALEKKAK